MSDDQKPILDPEKELPVPHDMQLDKGYEAQLGEAHKPNLPLTHYQNLPKPSFFSRYKFLIILLPILLLAGSGATYMYVSNSQKNPSPAPTMAVISPTSEPTVQPTIPPAINTRQEVANGILYTMPAMSISFVYPKDWYLESEQPTYVRIQNYNPVGAPGREYSAELDKGKVSLQVRQADEYGGVTTIAELIERLAEQDSQSGLETKITNQKTLTINGSKALYREEASYGTSYQVYFLDGEGYVVTMMLHLDVAAGKKDFDAITSTFRFINEPSLTTTPITLQPLDAAVNDLAKRLSVDTSAIKVISVEEREWSDSGLGCAQSGGMYMQVITPGYLIVLSDGTKQYRYHTNTNTTVVLCSKP